MAKKNYYAVVSGRKPGIYSTWFGEGGAEAQVKGYFGAKYKGFSTRQEAQDWLKGFSGQQARLPDFDAPAATEKEQQKRQPVLDLQTSSNVVTIYTDGSCIKNRGPGGYSAVVLRGSDRRELSAGFAYTTNNRMELMACIAALKSLPASSSVVLYSDSSYVINGITKHWAVGWRSRGWKKYNGDPVENPDLWEQLLDCCAMHKVVFHWVRGHSGITENERCDQLSSSAARRRNLPVDAGYSNNSK